MDISAEKFVDRLLSKEPEQQPSDDDPEKLDMRLPEDFDEKLFNQGRRFFWDYSFSLMSSMMLGLVAVLSIPSILKILISTRRSNSTFTAYRRYLSTLLHTLSWFEHDLKPGSLSWKSLYTVRTRHARAGMAAKLKGLGVVSQRDIALTQFGFIGFSVLKPDKLGLRQLQDGDWDAYVYFWRVIGHMIGLEDRYNICRPTAEETRLVCQGLLDRVFTPCLENVPEYFEHAARVMLEGMWSVNPLVDTEALLFWTRYLADVPGYVYTETDRILFQQKLKKKLQGKPLDTGVDSSSLVPKSVIEGLPTNQSRILYYKDFDKLETVPAYKHLTFRSKYKLAFNFVQSVVYTLNWGRLYFNWNFLLSVVFMRYLPYLAFFKFGVKESYVNIFTEDPTDDTKLITNSEYYKMERPEEPWYKKVLVVIW